MNPALIGILLQNFVPVIASVIRAHRNAAGTDPTDAQILAALQIDADAAIAMGEAFLASKQPK